MKTRKTFSLRKGAIAPPARFMEVAMPPVPREAPADGYEIGWPSGVRLRVPRGFCPEEMAMLLELLREGGED